jgi:hypothetical protein
VEAIDHNFPGGTEGKRVKRALFPYYQPEIKQEVL